MTDSVHYIVGIGTSAGGFDALEGFVRHARSGTGVSWIVVQHLPPELRNHTIDLLSRSSRLPVRAIRDGESPEPDTVHVLPPEVELELRDGRFAVIADREHPGRRNRVDRFFVSLARELGDRALGVVLSGSGDDGVEGAREIRARGGRVLVQEPADATFSSAPAAAIRSGLADVTLSAEDIPRLVERFAETGRMPSPGESLLKDARHSNLLDNVVRLLRDENRIDFGGYRRSMLLARIERRMHGHEIDDPAAYVTRLAESSDERRQLAREFLIGVTRFFRDPEVFDDLAQHVLPEIIESSDADRPVRIWVPGCHTGEEAYSIGIAIHEIVERTGHSPSLQVFATDVDHDAVARASLGSYPLSIAEHMSPERLERYFVREGGQYRIARRIREMIVFASHDLTSDPPLHRMDLISCRYVLIYFAQALRERVLADFHFALRERGRLVLGAGESTGALDPEFRLVSRAHRIFVKDEPLRSSLQTSSRSRTPTIERAPVPKEGVPATAPAPASRSGLDLGRACTAVLEDAERTCVLLDARYELQHVFGDASRFLRVPGGNASLHVMNLVPEPLRVTLSSALQRASVLPGGRIAERIHVEDDDETVWLEMAVRHLDAVGGQPEQFLVTLTRLGEPGAGAHDPNDERVLYLEAELRHTRDHLQETIQALESSNDRMKTANDQLVDANERLQSTNEELHSVNEELHTVNAEYQAKIELLTELSTDLENLLNVSEVGTVFLDRSLRIRKFTPSAGMFLPVLPGDTGRSIAHLAHEIEGFDLVGALRGVVSDDAPFETRVRHADGKYLLVRIVPYRLEDGRSDGVVLTIVDVTDALKTQEQLARSEALFRQITENIKEVFWMVSGDGRELLYLSPQFETIYGVSPKHVGDDPWKRLELVHTDDRGVVEDAYTALIAKDSYDVEYRIVRPDGVIRWIRDRGFPIRDEDGEIRRVAGISLDVTEGRVAQQRMQALADELEVQANLDPLTRLLNRRGFEKTLFRELDRERRAGGTSVAVLIDCDDFKRINDSLGHAVGDLVLKEIAERMSRSIRPVDHIARIGGDEFLVLLPNTRLAEAVQVADRLRLSVSNSPLRIENETLRVTASVGIAVIETDTVSLEEIVRQAGKAIAWSKKAGKNRVSTTASGNGRSASDDELRDDLVDKLSRGSGLRVVTQEIRDIVRDRIVGYELLSRGPAGVFESPYHFFRVCVENNILTVVDLKCLKNCIERAASIASVDRFHVNLLPSTMIDLPPVRLASLFGEGDLPRKFCIEISEQQFVGDPANLLTQVDSLKNRGARVAIDDVGFGRSSLEALIVLQPDIIKIDRAFVHGVSTDRGKRRSLSRLLKIAESLDAEIVAEGVETREELDVVRDMGVRYAQGFFWDRPN